MSLCPGGESASGFVSLSKGAVDVILADADTAVLTGVDLARVPAESLDGVAEALRDTGAVVPPAEPKIQAR